MKAMFTALLTRCSIALYLVGSLANAADPPSPSRAFLFPDSDARRIKAAELLDLDAERLRLAINEIYARTCFAFKDPGVAAQLRSVIQACAPGDSRPLTPVEQANVMLIKRFEGYRQQYPDGFEATYLIRESGATLGVAVHECPEASCKVIGHLATGCSVNGDFRMDEMQGSTGWIYVRSSQCNESDGPADGYVPQSSLDLQAG